MATRERRIRKLRWWGEEDQSMMRRVWVPLMLAALGFVVIAHAEPPADTKPAGSGSGVDTKAAKDDTILDQDRMAQLFKEFKNNLLTLKGRLEKSESPEDRQRAQILD